MPSVEIQSEYRDLPLESLVESPLNPRRSFDQDALAELSESIRTQGILSPLLVRPLGEHTYEIVAGARRYRAAQRAGLDYAPVRIVDLTEAQALETSIVENLQRRDVHPLEEAQGFAALLNLETPKYSIEQIAAKCGKQPGYVASRLKLTELAPAVAEAFTKDEIGLGHALLLAKLQPEQQQEALPFMLSGAFRRRRQTEAHPPARSPSSAVDRAQHPARTRFGPVPQRRRRTRFRSRRLCRLPEAHWLQHRALRRHGSRAGFLYRSDVLPREAGRARSEDRRHPSEAGANQHRLRPA